MLLSRLGSASYFLGMLYFFAFLFAWGKWRWLGRRSRRFNTTKFFILSLLATCFLRCMSFLTLGVFDYQIGGARAVSDGGGDVFFDPASSGDQLFYDKVTFVLFDLPDFIAISTYVLLMIIWLENVHNCRRHWFSATRFRRGWMYFYLCFNVLFYAAQIVLYILMLWGSVGTANSVLKAIVYTEVAANLGLPVMMLLAWMVTFVRLSGFPYKSEQAKQRLGCINRNAFYWTMGRFLLGSFECSAAVNGWLASSAVDDNSSLVSIVFAGTFVLTELLPFCLSLADYRLFQLIMVVQTEREASVSWHASGGTPLTGDAAAAAAAARMSHVALGEAGGGQLVPHGGGAVRMGSMPPDLDAPGPAMAAAATATRRNKGAEGQMGEPLLGN